MGGEDLEKMLQDFDSNPEFQSVMEGMVNQMISKDVLYEPMKELREKVNSPPLFIPLLFFLLPSLISLSPPFIYSTTKERGRMAYDVRLTSRD